MKAGDIIREIVHVGRINQVEIARIIGCRQASISRIKNNSQVPSLKMAKELVKLAHKFKIKVSIEDIETRD